MQLYLSVVGFACHCATLNNLLYRPFYSINCVSKLELETGFTKIFPAAQALSSGGNASDRCGYYYYIYVFIIQ